MEQGYETNGLSLNPMYFWKYVMSKEERTVPVVLFLDVKPCSDQLSRLSKTYPNVTFVIESKEFPEGVETSLPNVTYRWRDNLEYKYWLKSLAVTDYAVVNKKTDLWKQVALCGVSIVDAVPKAIKVLNNAERVDNWDSARSRLT